MRSTIIKDFKTNLILNVKKLAPQKSGWLHRFVTQLCETTTNQSREPELEKIYIFFSLWDLKNTGLGFLPRFLTFVCFCVHMREWSAESQESFPAHFCASVKFIALKSCSYKTSACLGASLSSVWHSGLWRAAQDNNKVLQPLHDLTPPRQRCGAVPRCSSRSIPDAPGCRIGGRGVPPSGGWSHFTALGRETAKRKQTKSFNSKYPCFSRFFFFPQKKSYHVNAA